MKTRILFLFAVLILCFGFSVKATSTSQYNGPAECSFNSDCSSGQICACTGAVNNCSYMLGYCVASSTPIASQSGVLTSVGLSLYGAPNLILTPTSGFTFSSGEQSRKLFIYPKDQYGGYWGAVPSEKAPVTVGCSSSDSSIVSVDSVTQVNKLSGYTPASCVLSKVSGGTATITITATTNSTSISATFPATVFQNNTSTPAPTTTPAPVSVSTPQTITPQAIVAQPKPTASSATGCLAFSTVDQQMSCLENIIIQLTAQITVLLHR